MLENIDYCTAALARCKIVSENTQASAFKMLLING